MNVMHPWMLLFGFGVLIPILIHYWNRRNHVPIRWAATLYLEKALQRVSKRISFNQVSLLILRMVLVVGLTLAIAAPLKETSLIQLRNSQTRSTLHMLLIDTSYSMSAAIDSSTRIEVARDIAAQIVSTARSNDAMVVLTFDNRLTEIVKNPDTDRQKLLNEIDLISATSRRSRLSNVLQQLKDLVSQTSNLDFDQIEIHWISDFAKTDWDFSEDPQRVNLWQEIQEMSAHRRHPVTLEPVSNYCLTNLTIPIQPLLLNQSSMIVAELTNHGGTEEQNVVVELLENQKIVGSKSVGHSPNSSQPIRFSVVPSRQGNVQYQARIVTEDALKLDNSRFVSAWVKEKFSVLFVEGRPDSCKYLKLAIEPERAPDSEYQIETTTARSLEDANFDLFDTIVLDNLRDLSQPVALRLRQFIASGKVVILFLGDQVDRNQFNQDWTNPIGEIPPLKLRLEEVKPIDNYEIDPNQYLSPLISPFRGNLQSGLLRIPVWRYFNTKPLSAEGIRVDLKLNNDDPLLLTCELGKGKCIVFTTASSSQAASRTRQNPSWNINESVPGFTALFLQVIEYCRQGSASPGLIAGETAQDEFAVDPRVQSHLMLNPAGDTVEIQTSQFNGIYKWTSESFGTPGIYQLSLKTSDGEKEYLYEANLETDESNLTLMEGIGEWSDEASHVQNDSRNQAPRLFLFQVISLILAGVFLLESLLALRWGRSG